MSQFWILPFYMLEKFFFSSSGTPIIQMLVCLILSQRSLRLSSVLFILFTLFCSSEVISTILSSSSLIHSSASDILLLIPSRVFLISVIVLFISVCLFFNSSTLEGNTEGPGTASSEPHLPSWSRQERRFPCVVWKGFPALSSRGSLVLHFLP